MSGPKVVRVISREELLAEAEDQIRRVDAAIARCERTARRHDAWTATRAASVGARRRELQRLADTERWPALRQAVTAELAFLKEEHARIVGEIEDAAERALRRRQRVADAARGIARALEAAGRPVPPALSTVGARAVRAPDEGLPALESEVAAAMRGLGGSAVEGSNDAERALAERLARGEEATSVAQWRAAREEATSTTDARLLRLLAKLVALSPERAHDFAARIDEVAAKSGAARRALLTDSLTLEIAGEVERARERDARHAALEAAEARIRAIDSQEARALRDRILEARAIAGADADALVREAEDFAATAARRVAAAARRRAVLEGLAALGYELREHLETAWATNGRIVVQQPNRPDYGVELAAAADAERIQVRLVGAAAPVSPRSTARDRDAETRWCTQVAELRASLAASGTALEIERSLPAGAADVKTVVFEDTVAAPARSRGRPQTRKREL